MKKMSFLTVIILSGIGCYSQEPQKLLLKEPVPGVCNNSEVYRLFPVKGQQEAVYPAGVDSIEKQLNKEVKFLQKNRDYKDHGTIRLVINCNGELVQCTMQDKTKSAELDDQLLAVIRSLRQWKVARLDGRPVDSSLLWGIEIRQGQVYID